MTPRDRERLTWVRKHCGEDIEQFLLRLLTEAEGEAQRLDTQLAQCAVTVANLELTCDRLHKALEAAPDPARCLPIGEGYTDWYDTTRAEALK